jgi:hypothetical protein
MRLSASEYEYCHEDPTLRISGQSYKSLFTGSIWIRERQSPRIFQRHCGIRKIDLMLPQICRRLGRIPLEPVHVE